MGRPLGERLSSRLGQVIIENVGGAGGSRGTALVARSSPDGYTLLLGGTGAMVVAPLASRRPLYDPEKDYEPIARVAVVGLAIVVNPSVRVRNLKEMVEYARANAEKLTIGSSGTGTVNHFTIERFKMIAAVPGIAHLPHSGAGALLNDIIGGHIPFGVMNVTGNVLELHRQEKVRILALTTPQRIETAPDIPTTSESGFAELEALTFAGLFAPRGTPKNVIDRIVRATHETLADPEIRRIYLASGFTADTEPSPEMMRDFLREELVKWKPVIVSIGFSLE